MKLEKLFLVVFIVGIFTSCNQTNTDKDIDFKLSYEDTISKKPYYAYVIIDNSGSTKADNTEIITIDDLKELFWLISTNGGGKFWLNFIDDDADNNQAKYIDIPKLNSKPVMPGLPNQNQYTSLQYSKLLNKYKVVEKEFELAIQKYKEDSTQIREFINGQDIEKIKEFQEYIYLSNPSFSDCFGEINAGIKAVNSGEVEVNKIIFAFSDLKQDTRSNLKRFLIEIPKDVIIVRIHHSTDLPVYEWIYKDISYKKDIYQFIK